MTCLTFIIPVRHPDSSNRWDVLIKNLKETIQSISAQTSHRWKCVVVANSGAELPNLPEKFEVCFVNFPPNKLYTKGIADQGAFQEAVKFDKGKRILSGILHAKSKNYLMFVDDDDFIHRDLTKFVCKNKGENGWYIPKGMLWKDGSNLLMNFSRFNMYCGTSHIVRSDLLDLDKNEEDIDIEYIKRMLGSHIHLKSELDKNQTPLKALPFRGAIYRIGHSDTHSKNNIFDYYFSMNQVLKHPLSSSRHLFALRLKTKKIKANYFGIVKK